ncbi:uncharacterized protein [Atheta coriaria]|uniref:uncharacterized protein n=1 Tax=Dalotia coriaria TaxID=877792 RepID=UPI0031F3C115
MKQLTALIVLVLACSYGAEASNLTSTIAEFVYQSATYIPMQIFLTCDFALKHFTLPVLTYFVNITITFFQLDEDFMPDFVSGLELMIHVWIDLAQMNIAGSEILANSCLKFAELLDNGSYFISH